MSDTHSYKTLLVAVDGSAQADYALGHAMALAHDLGARLILVSVVDSISLIATAGPYVAQTPDLIAIAHEEGKQILAAAAEFVSSSSVPYEKILADGSPVDQIIAIATQQRANMSIMGTHGRSGLGRLILGSVAEGVIHKSHVPVLIARVSNEKR